MRTESGRLTSRGGLALLALCASAAFTPALADDSDPPGRVARLSDVEGAVSLQPAGMQDWTAATLNRPLTTGDRLWADHDSRAELDLGDAVIRLGSVTAFAFLNLDDTRAQLQVTAGTLLLRVREVSPNQIYEIDTPNTAVLLQQPGAYRVDVSQAGDATVVKVSEGAAQASGLTQTVSIAAGEQLTFTGAPTPADNSATPGPPDGLDEWSTSRDGQYDDSTSAEYVADNVPGLQDLDNNGRWQDTPEYGYVWAPTAIVVGWVPYRYGHWVWVTPWGWTWVDDAAWGYAPFHYGRWTQWHNSWCWVPGPSQVRRVYAPALVAWVGGVSRGTAAVPQPNTGWFPLGPREVYMPAYPASANYVRNVNIGNTTIVSASATNGVAQKGAATRYANNRPEAITVVPQQILTSGQRVGGHALHLTAAMTAKGTVSAAAPALAPIPQSVLGPNEGRGAARPPATLLQRRVLARTPPPHAPALFEKQLAVIQENGGRPLAGGEIARLQAAAPVAPVKLVATSPVIGTASLPRHTGAHEGHTPAGQGAAGTASLAERERKLQSVTPLPPAPRASGAAASAAHASVTPAGAIPTEQAPTAPVLRTDRPPWAQQTPAAAPLQAFAPDEVAHGNGTSPSTTEEHPAPSSPAAGARPQQSGQTVESHPATPPGKASPAASAPATHPPAQPAHPPEQTAQPPAPPPKQSATDPRDEAPHGDRDSRERATR